MTIAANIPTAATTNKISSNVKAFPRGTGFIWVCFMAIQVSYQIRGSNKRYTVVEEKPES
jgi:hypothetical protein